MIRLNKVSYGGYLCGAENSAMVKFLYLFNDSVRLDLQVCHSTSASIQPLRQRQAYGDHQKEATTAGYNMKHRWKVPILEDVEENYRREEVDLGDDHLYFPYAGLDKGES
ncbi:hypothetical protein Tco_0533378 [Tanacetum coccineum]